MPQTASIVFCLFFPACLGILGQAIWQPEISHQLLAIGFVLFCVDQARMANLDLENITKARQYTHQTESNPDHRLNFFHWVTVSTIVIELVGFYLASRWLGWGIVIVLVSQIWFNAQATIEIHPLKVPPIQSRSWQARTPVLIADLIGILLILLWIAQVAPLVIVLGLWGMAFSYAIVKYAMVVNAKWGFDRNKVQD